LFIVQHFGHTQAAGLLLYLQISLILTFNLSIGHAIYDEAILVFPLLIVFSGLIFGKRSAVLVTAISLAQIALLFLLAEAGHVRPFDGALEMRLDDTITTCVILLATGFLMWVVVDIIERSVDQINQSELEIENAYDQTLIAWAKALELRAREDPGHSARVSSLTRLFAEDLRLGSEVVKSAWRGALLHDIGKMGVPESILLKSENLEPDERTINQTHTHLGRLVFQDIDYLVGALDVVAHHHERYDGQGYPDRLEGESIPYLAQIFTIVDCWDVLRTERPCRPALTDEETLNFLKEQSGKKFNPELIDRFLDLVEKFGLKEF
jgi:putative nucleotidyltransferase with HDIG domain